MMLQYDVELRLRNELLNTILRRNVSQNDSFTSMKIMKEAASVLK
jgi:hypothetical protein